MIGKIKITSTKTRHPNFTSRNNYAKRMALKDQHSIPDNSDAKKSRFLRYFLALLFGLVALWGIWPDLGNNTANLNGLRHSANEVSCSPTAIEKIEVGEVVLAWDEELHRQIPRKVVRLFRNTSDHIRYLTVESEDGMQQEIGTTDGHPFWVPGRGWVDAGDLVTGDKLRESNGNVSELVDSQRLDAEEEIKIFNFEVEGSHTYYVAADSSSNAILVHNSSAGSAAKAIRKAIRHGAPKAARTLASALKAAAKKCPKGAKTVVLGEGMDNIKNIARGLRDNGVNSKWYQAWGKNFPKGRKMTPKELEAALKRNERWIRQKIKEGYKFYDIGIDPSRSTRSPFYELEQRILKEFGIDTIPVPRG